MRIAAQADSTSRDDGSRDARGDTPPDVQRLLDQYGDPQCSDFETQQQAQAVFELDQILFGDALDPDVNGASLATSSSTTKTRKAETAQKANVQKILYSKPAAPLKDLSPLCRTKRATGVIQHRSARGASFLESLHTHRDGATAAKYYIDMPSQRALRRGGRSAWWFWGQSGRGIAG